jgi:hypothetical protein
MIDTVEKPFDEYVIARQLTGSRFICLPPPEHTDKGTVLLVEPGYEASLSADGWSYTTTDTEYQSMGSFVSWRKGEENYIVTTDKSFYDKFVLAAKVARELNLMFKSSRIALFQAILYGS